MCDGLIFQGHQSIKHFEEKLPVIDEVNEQEILLDDCSITNIQGEEKPKKNTNNIKQDPFEDFVKNIKTQSSPPHAKEKELPKCEDYCYLWRLLSEITALKVQIDLKDELLAQQLKIIKVLATRLFIMQACFKRMDKTPEELLSEEILSGRIFSTNEGKY